MFDVPQLEVLAALQRQLCLGLALDAFQSQHDLLGGLGLLVEDGLGLTTVTGLLAVISALSLGEQRGLARLVLGDLVLGVLAAFPALAVGVSRLRNVDLFIVLVSLRVVVGQLKIAVRVEAEILRSPNETVLEPRRTILA